MGSGRADDKSIAAANETALYSLERTLRSGTSGIYEMIASPRTQAAVMKRFEGENIGLHDFSGKNRKLTEISDLLDREPRRRAYVFLNFHLALWDVDKWNIDAVRRLNFSRNGLANRGQVLIFCVTPEADALLNRRALDFYDFIKLTFRFQDEPEAREIIEAIPIDRSTGIDVEIDFSRPKEELLALAISLGHQADELLDKAQYADALKLLHKQRDIRERILGVEDTDTAESYNNIGYIYDELGNYSVALEWYLKAMQIAEKVLGTEHPYTATSYNNIGYAYKEQGKYADALEWHFKALKILEKVLGTEHPNTATSYNNIGSIYVNQGEYTVASKWYFKALRIDEKVLGTEHPDTAIDYNNIGYVYNKQSNYASALEWYFKALKIREKVLGTEHPSTAASYNNIGGVYNEQGEYAAGLEWYFKALKIDEKVLGTEHPSTAIDYNNIGWVYREQGEYAAALEWYLKALRIREKVLGADHPHTKDVRESIRNVQQAIEAQAQGIDTPSP